MKRKPIIGITAKGTVESTIKSVYYDSYHSLPTLYIDAVRRAGGIPVLLPPGGDDNPADIVAGLDAIIFSGGTDINPEIYGGNPDHPELTSIDPERDATELPLARYVVEAQNIPVLFICRGFQVLNVALGGTLHEHVADVYDHDLHRNEEGTWTIHDVRIEADSRLATVCATTLVRTFSGHHQSIKRVADGLKIVATAPDGTIEGLELEDHPWLLAVQWHPEKSAAEDITQQRLFNGLVEAAKNFADTGVHSLG